MATCGSAPPNCDRSHRDDVIVAVTGRVDVAIRWAPQRYRVQRTYFLQAEV